MSKVRDRYTDLHRRVLVPVAERLEALLRDHLKGIPRVDRVTVRAKSPESFKQKSAKHSSSGARKYTDPLRQIQDQIGARVIVFYASDVDAVRTTALRYFRPVETRVVVPDSVWSFGYSGVHLILDLPLEAVPSNIAHVEAPPFFELQVRTLFQHAWSEAEHDLGYKQVESLNDDQTRRLAFAAAQAWGADRVFADLLQELSRGAKGLSLDLQR